MAYPTGMLSLTLERVDRVALSVKSMCQSRITSMAAGDTTASVILDVYRQLWTADHIFGDAVSVSGIVAYARDQKNDAELDVAAAFSGMRTAIQAAMSWILANFPASNGYLLASALNSSVPEPQDRVFSSAITAGLRTALQAIVDEID